jgi:hypothetical protein
MKRFAFRVSDEDRAHISQLELAGTHITVNLDPVAGGVFMVHEDASLTWTWLQDIDFSAADDDGDDVDGDLTSPTDVGEAVSWAIAAGGPQAAGVQADGLEIEVTDDDFERLRSLQVCGYSILLSLDPHTGGIEAAHRSGSSLKWSFVSAIDLKTAPELKAEVGTDDLATMMTAFQGAISA